MFETAHVPCNLYMYKQVYHQQTVLNSEQKRTICLRCYLLSPSGSVNTLRRTQRYYTVLSMVNGKIYNASMLLQQEYIVLYSYNANIIIIQTVFKIFCI